VRSALQATGAAVARLSPREQRLLALFAGLVAAAVLYLLVLEPIVAGRARLAARVDGLQRDLPQMEALAARIRELEASLGNASASTATADFSLFGFLDRAAASSVSRESIASMSPSRRPLRDGVEESIVELRLNAATLPQLVALLEHVESAEQPVYVKRLEMKRRYDDDTRFDATIVVGTLART
jgi:type II secretory pathway component PulM